MADNITPILHGTVVALHPIVNLQQVIDVDAPLAYLLAQFLVFALTYVKGLITVRVKHPRTKVGQQFGKQIVDKRQ